MRAHGPPTLDRMRELVDLLGTRTDLSGHPHHRTMARARRRRWRRRCSAQRDCAPGPTPAEPLLVNERLSIDDVPIGDEAFTEVLSGWPCSSPSSALARPASNSSPRPRSRGSPTRRWTWRSSRWVGGHLGLDQRRRRAVAVLTNVSYDHTDVLGPTLEGIATDKSGSSNRAGVVWGDRPRPRRPDPTRADEVGAAEVWLRARSSTAPPTGGRRWPSGRPADAGAHYGEILLRCTAPTKGRTPRARSPPSKPSSPLP